jgi:hypothetical protein
MKVKIGTAVVLGEDNDRKRYEAGSVVEVTAEQFEQNSSWMTATDEPLKEAPAPKTPPEA